MLIVHSALASDIITFEIGPLKKIFHLHSDLVAKLSRPLSTLINGPFKEAHERRVVWAETEVETFLFFAEFAMTGDYRVIKAAASNTTNDKAAPTQTAVGTTKTNNTPPPPQYRATANTISPATYIWQRWTKQVFKTDFAPPTDKIGLQKQNDGEVVDMGCESLLRHAKVYVFAEYHDIGPLRQLAIHKINSLLRHMFETGKDRNNHIIRFLEYCYTNAQAAKGRTDPLRMVAIACAWIVRRIFFIPDCGPMVLRNHVDLAPDLIWAMCQTESLSPFPKPPG